MQARMAEAVSDLFAMHWPFKQPKAGRDLRRGPLHDRWAAQGAVFGLTAGWERGLWYADRPSERDLPPSVGAQPWWPIAAREAGRMASGTVLLDLSPFTKLRLSGAGTLAGLNALSTAQLDLAPGRAVYTQLLNPRGGIEMDVTVTRLDADRVDITSGAATRWRDIAWLRRNLPGTVTIEDRTEARCVIGVMGATAGAILRGLAPDWPEMAFGDLADVVLAGVPARATRISYVGAPGCEIDIAADRAGAVFDALIAAGAGPMGHLALDACRIEKGYRHWGHDIGPDLTPLEAGLGFTIDWKKPFQGRDALLAQRAAGLTRRLALLSLTGDPLMLHDEPVFEGGAFVGLTTSGGRGPRTGLTLAFALIAIPPGESLAQTCARAFTVEVAGRRYAARALPRAPFDPDGQEMRG
jgi:4-methylaminobutanoate oxidase (formaldehyde-forming)